MPNYYLSKDKDRGPVIGITGESKTMYFFKITNNPAEDCEAQCPAFNFYCTEQRITLYKHNIKNYRDHTEMPLVPRLEKQAKEIDKLTKLGFAVTPN